MGTMHWEAVNRDVFLELRARLFPNGGRPSNNKETARFIVAAKRDRQTSEFFIEKVLWPTKTGYDVTIYWTGGRDHD